MGPSPLLLNDSFLYIISDLVLEAKLPLWSLSSEILRWHSKALILLIL